MFFCLSNMARQNTRKPDVALSGHRLDGHAPTAKPAGWMNVNRLGGGLFQRRRMIVMKVKNVPIIWFTRESWKYMSGASVDVMTCERS